MVAFPHKVMSNQRVVSLPRNTSLLLAVRNLHETVSRVPVNESIKTHHMYVERSSEHAVMDKHMKKKKCYAVAALNHFRYYTRVNVFIGKTELT